MLGIMMVLFVVVELSARQFSTLCSAEFKVPQRLQPVLYIAVMYSVDGC